MTGSTCEILDPRIRRTRRMLQEALEKLLESKDFDRISVQDIASAAAVNRATFYDHYDDKFALLQCLVGNRFHELLAQRQVSFDGSCSSALRAMVLVVCEYLARLQGPRRSEAAPRPLEPHMESAIIAVVRRLLLEGLRSHPSDRTIAPETVAAAASWALYGAVREWSQAPHPCLPDEIADEVVILIAPILQLPIRQPQASPA